MKKVIYLSVLFFVAATSNMTAQDEQIFPEGEKAENVNHTGDVWLSGLNEADDDVDSEITQAVFAPNAKLNWHAHSAGQILLVTEGEGYYQEKGEPVQVVRKGDVIKANPNVEHWHGSTPTSGVTYLSVSPKSKTTWLDSVSDEEYQNIEEE